MDVGITECVTGSDNKIVNDDDDDNDNNNNNSGNYSIISRNAALQS
jgi:hypothetical protein